MLKKLYSFFLLPDRQSRSSRRKKETTTTTTTRRRATNNKIESKSKPKLLETFPLTILINEIS
jgi:hypothetical protein